MVMDFIAKGEKLMQDPNCPKFLDGHVKKLREAWEDTNEKAQLRKKALADNLSSWETFEEQKVENHKQLDLADAEFEAIKKVFDLKAGPADYELRMKTAASFRKGIQDIFNTVSGANDCLQQMLPDEKKAPMAGEVQEIRTRMDILKKTDERLEFIWTSTNGWQFSTPVSQSLRIGWEREERGFDGNLGNPVELLSP
eukprot:TRINITY_DN5485_c0_g1_i5.p1 TRINITY_DN5485_c0_g1~~TRINITY_DN5485_c0_g1_i5.p1  ORF type:complete len:197 (-),score=51.45 TRINITY_DN5485_c0_g1_i5:107-697(-)